MTELRAPTLAEVRAARERLPQDVLDTPCVPVDLGTGAEVWAKLENLSPLGSFKGRGSGNALALAAPEAIAKGVVTASAGNMGQGVAWHARRLGVPCRVLVPDSAPAAKLGALVQIGAEVHSVPFPEWWRALETGSAPGLEGAFVHPVADTHVIAGNGTIALELVEAIPDLDTVLVPFGGGGLACGIAAALRELSPRVQVWACEVETAAPLNASLAAGEPRSIEMEPSFVDGIGGAGLVPGMWPLVRELVSGAALTSVTAAADAVRLLATKLNVVAEGAGAVPIAVAQEERIPGNRIACVVSGGHLNPATLAAILRHEVLTT